jgi:hypothetical protein
MCRDQMPSAAGFGHIDPVHRKAQRLKFGADNVAGGAHAGEIQRPAILVHQPFEQRFAARCIAFDKVGHASFG